MELERNIGTTVGVSRRELSEVGKAAKKASREDEKYEICQMCDFKLYNVVERGCEICKYVKS